MILSGFLRKGGSWVSKRMMIERGTRGDSQRILGGRHRMRMRPTCLRERRRVCTTGSARASRKTPAEASLFIFLINIITYIYNSHHRPTITNEPSLATTSPSIRFLPGNPTRFCTNTSDRRCLKPSTEYKGCSPPTADTSAVGASPGERGLVLTRRWAPRVLGG